MPAKRNKLVSTQQLEEAIMELRLRKLFENTYGKPEKKPDWEPYLFQRLPDPYILGEYDDSGNLKPWWLFLLIGGRGVGKTRTGVQAVIEHLREFKSKARVCCGAPTLSDARSVLAEGESGLIKIFGNEFTQYNRSLLEAWHKDGGYVRFLGSEEPARFNGPQWTMMHADELALWVEESWDQALFGLRLGDNPYAVATTTPKNRLFVKNLMDAPGVVVHYGVPTDMNENISKRTKERLYAKHGNTRLGQQELGGLFIEEVEGAMWKQEWIDATRILKTIAVPDMVRVVVAVDPAGSTGKHSADTGIVVAGKGVDGRYYVWIAQGVQLSPHGWASLAVDFYDQELASAIVAERNYGGDMVLETLQTVRPDIHVEIVTASRGKQQRAEPIAALYEQGKVSHIGYLTVLEEQQTSFRRDVATDKQTIKMDVLDACVWAITSLADPDNELEVHEFSGQPEGIKVRELTVASNQRLFTVSERGNFDPYVLLPPRGTF